MEATVFALVNVAEAAKTLGISQRMVRVLAESGKLTGTKIGYMWVFDPSDVVRLAAERSAEKSSRIG